MLSFKITDQQSLIYRKIHIVGLYKAEIFHVNINEWALIYICYGHYHSPNKCYKWNPIYMFFSSTLIIIKGSGYILIKEF